MKQGSYQSSLGSQLRRQGEGKSQTCRVADQQMSRRQRNEDILWKHSMDVKARRKAEWWLMENLG